MAASSSTQPATDLAMKDSDGTRQAQSPGRSPRRRSCFSGYGISTVTEVTDVEIYYGTMFGAAERFARALAHEIMIHRQARVHIQDLDAFDEDTFARPDRLSSSRLFVIVVSTHFAGAPSPSAERFRDWIRDMAADPIKATSAQSSRLSRMSSRLATMAQDSGVRSVWPFQTGRCEPLRGMQYTVFAVGDSIYLTYNAMGKLVDLKLKQLGALRFHPLGLGDTSNNMDATFQAWQCALLAKLPRPAGTPSAYAVSSTDKVSSSTVVPWRGDKATDSISRSSPDRQLDVVDNFGIVVPLDFQCRTVPKDQVEAAQLYSLYHPPSCATETMTPLGPRTPRIALFDRLPFADMDIVEMRPGYGSNRSSRRAATFRVRLRSPETSYVSVSTLAVFPENTRDYVTRIAEAFDYDLDAVIELTPPHVDGRSQQQQLPFPTPCTVRTALTEFLEVRTLTREFVCTAAGFVATADERKMLEHLGSSEGATAFRTQIAEQYRGVLELVELAPTLRLPLEVFVNITPPIKPRFYTIASSPRVSPHEFDVAVSLGVAGEPHGLGVSYLERIVSLPHGTRVPFRGFISWSRFQFPDDSVSPMVLISMGVGLSAMRSIIQERLSRWFQAQRTASTNSDQGGQSPTRLANRTLPATIPPMLLFLGASSKEHIVFRNDLNHWEQQMMVKVHYAFSNDPQHAKRHVQDVVASRMEEIVDVLKSSNGSRIFVCGRVNLVHRIRDMFEADQMRRGSRWFDTIYASGRFVEEGFN